MRSLSVQVQPDRSPGIDMARLTASFQDVVSRIDLVRHHAFDTGNDNGLYYNFTFGTERASELWYVIHASIYQSDELREHMAAASMAMCSGEAGWDDYVQLYHWDPEVPVVPSGAL